MTGFELAREVLDWAKTPGNHGGNPYAHKFVQMAEEMVSKNNNDGVWDGHKFKAQFHPDSGYGLNCRDCLRIEEYHK